MKKSHFIPAFLLSAALLSGLAGCKKETEYYNPNAQTSSVTETQTELQTEHSTQASTEESTEASTEASTEESTEASTEESTAAHVVSKELAVGEIPIPLISAITLLLKAIKLGSFIAVRKFESLLLQKMDGFRFTVQQWTAM